MISILKTLEFEVNIKLKLHNLFNKRLWSSFFCKNASTVAKLNSLK